MIYLFSGVPGSGKSYHAAEMICNKFKQGKNIICNFDIDFGYLKKISHRNDGLVFSVSNEDLKYPDWLYQFSDHFHKCDSSGRVEEAQTYLFIDECNINFDSRTWNEAGRSEWIQFLSEHRKYGFQIFLITQSVDDIDRKIRKRIEIEVKHFKADNFKLFGKVLSFLCGGHLFVQRSQWYSKSKFNDAKIDTTFCRGRKKYYKLFNTSQTFAKTSVCGVASARVPKGPALAEVLPGDSPILDNTNT